MRNYHLLVGGTLLSLIMLLAFFAPYLPFVDAELTEQVMYKDEEGVIHVPPYPPSAEFPLGSDWAGVDFLSMLLMGAKETLFMVFAILILRYIIAVPLGIGAYYSKVLRFILNCFYQFSMSMPPVFLVSIFIGFPIILFSDVRPIWMVTIIALIDVGRIAKLFYQSLVEIGKKSFVESGIVSGCTKPRLFFKYFWPFLQPHLFTNLTFDAGRILFLLAQFGVMGIFIQHTYESQLGGYYQLMSDSIAWPMYFYELLAKIRVYEWIPLSAVGAISITMIAIYLTGEGLQRYFHQKYNRNGSVDL
ncbi:ABC transporter permease subunit [Bacillus litorisediminis]|uniref:ABC transporter permease subunit n=1 Tax=Bacillus litorisediminis TaxID=2922713 RepID=UPI001FAD5D31|nr:ABC transporter permease subunit [Bacillus litorisediminis]